MLAEYLARIHRRDAVGLVRRVMKGEGRAVRALVPTDWDGCRVCQRREGDC